MKKLIASALIALVVFGISFVASSVGHDLPAALVPASAIVGYVLG